MLQSALVGLLVAFCALNVAWTLLLPAAWRRRIALGLLRWRWPPAIKSRLERHARNDADSACGSCEHRCATTAKPLTIHIVKRARR